MMIVWMLLMRMMQVIRIVDASVCHVSDGDALATRDHHVVDRQDRLRVHSHPRHLLS